VTGGVRRRLVHLNDLGGWDNGDGIGLGTVHCEAGDDLVLPAYQGDAHAQLVSGLHGPSDYFAGRIIAAHCVKGYDSVIGHTSTPYR
jgi:hypothetical protein